MVSVLIALLDFFPVLLFGAAAALLQRDLYGKMVKGAYALFTAGTIDVTMAGLLKALHKLLYALGVCDFQPLKQMFFPVQAIGFLLAGCGALSIGAGRSKGRKALAAAPPVYAGTFIFVGVMLTGLSMLYAGLGRTAAKMKKPAAVALFAVSFVFSLGMGYLASRDFTQPAMNWMAELVNIVAQGSLFAAALILHRSGLAERESIGD